MIGAVTDVLRYTLLPVAALLIGSVVATFRAPGPKVSSFVQHFAAGVVFAAVAGEVLPQITHREAPIAVIIGFSLGVAAMLGVKQLSGHGEEGEGGEHDESPTGLLVAVGVDLAIDGLLVGIGFAAGQQTGLLLTIALTLEILFLGLSTTAALLESGASRGRVLATSALLAGLVALGAGLGATLLANLSGWALELVLSFGLAALLYLVTEELLVEAHEVPDTPLTTAAFFLGFLVLLLIEMLT